mgnify:CR=1 FL=1
MSRNLTSKLLGLVLLGTIAFGASFSSTSAGTGLTIQPVKVSNTLKPGETVSGNIRLSSASDGDAIQVEASVEDFIPVAGAESIQFVGRAPGVTTVRDWITLGGDEVFKLKEGEAVNIPYTITAPWDAEPGSHFGVAFFKATRPAINGQQQLSIGTRIGMLILITVPGSHLQKGKILDFTGPSFIQKTPADFKIKFENLGTVHFEPKGTLAISNMFGSVVAKVPIEGQTVLPTGIKDISVSWRAEGWLLGKYNAVATLYDGEGTAMTTSSASFWVIPIWYILGALVSLIILFLIFRWVRRRVRISIVSE